MAARSSVSGALSSSMLIAGGKWWRSGGCRTHASPLNKVRIWEQSDLLGQARLFVESFFTEEDLPWRKLILVMSPSAAPHPKALGDVLGAHSCSFMLYSLCQRGVDGENKAPAVHGRPKKLQGAGNGDRVYLLLLHRPLLAGALDPSNLYLQQDLGWLRWCSGLCVVLLEFLKPPLLQPLAGGPSTLPECKDAAGDGGNCIAGEVGDSSRTRLISYVFF